MPVLSEAAYAKLNLFLHITGRRADGYHLLESLVVFADCADRIDVVPAHDLTLAVTGPFASALTTGNDNLALRAAHLLREKTGCAQGAAITLHKNLPVGAGLGGGSADAAAALRALARLWNVALEEDGWLSLGSDVPVCLIGRPSLVRGIGEEVMPVAFPGGLWVVLANPGVALLTADVYRRFAGTFSPQRPLPSITSVDMLMRVLRDRHNALEAPAMALLPVIGETLAALAATPGCLLSRMSGSGATCFGLYAGEGDAARAARRLRASRPRWWVEAARLFSNFPSPLVGEG